VAFAGLQVFAAATLALWGWNRQRVAAGRAKAAAGDRHLRSAQPRRPDACRPVAD